MSTKRNQIRLAAISVFTIAITLCQAGAKPPSQVNDRGIEVQLDQPVRIPESLLQKGVSSGLATIVVSVDEFGFLEDWLLIEASDTSLVEVVADAIEGWEFRPAIQNGHPVAARQSFPIRINAAHALQAYTKANAKTFSKTFFDPADRSEIRTKQLNPTLFTHPSKLDRTPKLLRAVKPKVSPEAYQQSKGASVRFNFYLDSEGNVRMPSVSKISEAIPDEAILAAQQALEQWSFDAPTHQGKPATTQLAQTIHFSHLY